MTTRKIGDPGFWSTFGFLTTVKYGGIIGKLAAIVIVFFLVLCCVVAFGHAVAFILWGVLVLALAGLVFSFLVIRSIFVSNPEMATLEGSEVIRYRQLDLNSKNQLHIPVIQVSPDPELPAPETISIQAQACDEEAD